MNALARLYIWLIKFGTVLIPIALLIVRLAWGWESLESGHGHLKNLDATIQFFQSLNIPAPRANAIMSGSTEMIGGALLMIGLGSRLAAIALVGNFIVAIVTWLTSSSAVTLPNALLTFLASIITSVIAGPSPLALPR